MSVQLQRGMRPWQPTSASELVETYDFYDMPLMGVIDQGGRKYLFQCLAGQVEPFSLWSYVPLTTDDIAYLEEVDGERFASRVLAFEERTTHFAAALNLDDDIGIVAWVDVRDVPDDESPVQWMADAVHRFSSTIQEQSERVERLALAHG